MKINNFFRIPGVLLLCLAGASCATQAPPNPDPWEPMNRKLYTFNNTLDHYVVEPTARGYQKAIPGFVRIGVRNFFQNLDDVKVVVNDVLQLKLGQAAQDSGRFLLNSTVGIAGLFDVASEVGLYKNYEDFGQTLGRWGVGPGPYLVVPLVGSSTLRDTVGLIPDVFLNPVFWIDDSATQWSAYALERIDARVQFLLVGDLRDEASDEYIYVRDALLQRREFLVNDGAIYDDDDWEEWD